MRTRSALATFEVAFFCAHDAACPRGSMFDNQNLAISALISSPRSLPPCSAVSGQTLLDRDKPGRGEEGCSQGFSGLPNTTPRGQAPWWSVKSGSSKLATGAACVAILVALLFSPVQAQEAPALPAGAAKQKIAVELVSGTVRYRRDGQFFRVTPESNLTQGDTVVVDGGAVCKLEFQHPTSGAVLSAVILRGYTEMTVAEAYLQGESARTQLDIPQGNIRAGVVRTAVPPSFQVRTPRVVVGVRGTEIAELAVSSDRGDYLRIGHVGTTMVHNGVPLSRSARAGQGSRKRVEGDLRGDTLLRAIEDAILEYRVVLTGPHRSSMEIDFDRHSGFDLVQFPGDFYKSEGNPQHDAAINSGRSLACPLCDQRPSHKK